MVLYKKRFKLIIIFVLVFTIFLNFAVPQPAEAAILTLGTLGAGAVAAEALYLFALSCMAVGVTYSHWKDVEEAYKVCHGEHEIFQSKTISELRYLRDEITSARDYLDELPLADETQEYFKKHGLRVIKGGDNGGPSPGGPSPGGPNTPGLGTKVGLLGFMASKDYLRNCINDRYLLRYRQGFGNMALKDGVNHIYGEKNTDRYRGEPFQYENSSVSPGDVIYEVYYDSYHIKYAYDYYAYDDSKTRVAPTIFSNGKKLGQIYDRDKKIGSKVSAKVKVKDIGEKFYFDFKESSWRGRDYDTIPKKDFYYKLDDKPAATFIFDRDKFNESKTKKTTLQPNVNVLGSLQGSKLSPKPQELDGKKIYTYLSNIENLLKNIVLNAPVEAIASPISYDIAPIAPEAPEKVNIITVQPIEILQPEPAPEPAPVPAPAPVNPLPDDFNYDDFKNRNEIDFRPLKNINFKDKFPFSLPWDIKASLELLVSKPEPPQWLIPIVNSSIDLDLSVFEDLAKIARAFLSVIYIVILVILTRRFVGGA